MKKIFLSLFLVSIANMLFAYEFFQGSGPQPSARQRALKQTEMIVRELRIEDSSLYRQLFDMHLHYALQYEDGCTRAQWLEKMEDINQDLQKILTKEQYDEFMNKQMQQGPRGPKPQVGRLGHYSEQRVPADATPDEGESQPQPQPADLP